MTFAGRARRFYWKHIRHYDSEICGNPDHRYPQIRRGCGRPVRTVWRASTGIWNYVITGSSETTYTVRRGAADGSVMERAEGVGGVLCLGCFDQLAREKGVYLAWEDQPL